VIGERLHLGAFALQDRHLKAAFVVEMHMQRRLRQIVMVVELLRQPLGQVTRVVVVDVDQRGDAVARSCHFDGRLFET
jgi:hypothetical protein